MTRTGRSRKAYGCLGCGRVFHNFKWTTVKIHMRACCPERMNAVKLRGQCQIGGRFCEVPGFESEHCHSWQHASYSQHLVHAPYRNWSHRDPYEYYGSWDRREEHVPSQKGNDGDYAASQHGNDTEYAYYGPSFASDRLRMSLLQASKQRFNGGNDHSNGSLQGEEPLLTDLQATQQRVNDDGRNNTAYTYYGPTSAGDQLRMSLLQASKKRLNDEEPPATDFEATGSKHRIDGGGRNDANDDAYYGFSSDCDQLQMTCLQASKQPLNVNIDSSNVAPQTEESAAMGIQARKQRIRDRRNDTDGCHHSYYGPTSSGERFRMSVLQASKQRLDGSIDSSSGPMEDGGQSKMYRQPIKQRVDDGTDTGLTQAQETVVLHPQAHSHAGFAIKIEDTFTKLHPAAALPPLQAWDLNVSSLRIKMEDAQPQKAALSSTEDETADSSTQGADDVAVKEVSQWLEKKVSHWSTMLKNKYTTSLVDYGFDSAAILDRDLTVENAEKILTKGVGMKRGHALSLRHALEDGL